MKKSVTEKQELRKELRARLKQISADERQQWSKQASLAFLKSNVWKTAESILFFASLPSELQTDFLIKKAWAENKRVIFPRVDNKTGKLDLFAVQHEKELEKGAFGILEPSKELKKEKGVQYIDEIDLALVPGLGVDQKGRRLGKGKGFYDRLLGDPQFRAMTIACVYHCQFVKKVPVESHDCSVQGVLTEKGLQFF